MEGLQNMEKELLHHNITDQDFTVIMVVEISNYLNRIEGHQYNIFTQKFHNSTSNTLKQFLGNVVRKDNNTYLISFKTVTDAVSCALKIQYTFKYVTPKNESFNRRLKIGIASYASVPEKLALFEDAKLLATQMCEVVKDELVISSEVHALYEQENTNAIIDDELIRTLNQEEEEFLNAIMNYIEANSNHASFNVATFSKGLGCSKSQLYRKLTKLTGKSPTNFIREFKLHQAIQLLHKQEGNISEIAYKVGFNSPTYFSKCFYDTYGILPSKYVQQHLG